MLLVSKGSIEQNNDLHTDEQRVALLYFVRGSVGERKTHVPRGGPRAKSANSRSPVQNATRNLSESVGRVLAFPAWELIGRVPRGTAVWKSASFSVFDRHFPNRKVHLQIRPINRNSTAKEEDEEEPIHKMMFKKLAVATREFLVGGL